MRSLLFVITLTSAVFIDLVSPFRLGGLAFPSFSVMAVIFWFWRIKMSSRLILATLLGFLFDSFHAFPPGTYLIAFWVEAILVDFLKVSFSDSRLPVIRGISFGIMFAVFSLAVISASMLAGRFFSEKVDWNRIWIGVLAGTALWSAVITMSVVALARFARR